MSNCDTCDSNTNCLTCITGYYITKSAPDTCTLCSLTINYCQECDSAVLCTKCYDGRYP